MKISEFDNLLQRKTLIGDGGMGTMLYQQGVFLNSCYDELNISRPKLVEQIHTQYIDAGADFIETNTFGANEIRLARSGLGEKVSEINAAAAKVAKKCASDKVLVAGSIGPSGQELNVFDDKKADVIKSAFELQAEVLCESGVDFLILETFTDPNELMLAVEAAAKTSLPIVAQMAIEQEEDVIKNLSKIADCDCVNVVGMNCILGPAQMLRAFEILRTVTDKPVSIQPNAGLPQKVEGRIMYVSTPEYMAEYAKRFYESGARIIGGCCGTTPEHIRRIALAVKAIHKSGQRQIKIEPHIKEIDEHEKVAAVPLVLKSKLGKKLASGQKVITIEMSPPRGTDTAALLERIKLCKDKDIDAVNVPDGPRASSRLSAMITAIKIQQEIQIETIVHFCCRDKNLISIQSDLLGMHAIGLRNILVITGDPPKLGEFPDATAVFDLDSISLCKVITALNHGSDIVSNKIDPPTALTLGVGANPVAVDIEREIERFKLKVAAGAEYAITQPVFDPKAFLDFIEATKDSGIPIIAGVWPFTSFKNAQFMANEVPGVSVPKEILDRMEKTKTAQEGKIEGVLIAREMIETLGDKAAGFALSAPFGNVNIALAAVGKIDLDEI